MNGKVDVYSDQLCLGLCEAFKGLAHTVFAEQRSAKSSTESTCLGSTTISFTGLNKCSLSSSTFRAFLGGCLGSSSPETHFAFSVTQLDKFVV